MYDIALGFFRSFPLDFFGVLLVTDGKAQHPATDEIAHTHRKRITSLILH